MKKQLSRFLAPLLALISLQNLNCTPEDIRNPVDVAGDSSLDLSVPTLRIVLTVSNKSGNYLMPFSASLFLPNQIPLFDSIPLILLKSPSKPYLLLNEQHLQPLLEEIVPGIPAHAGPDSIYSFSMHLKLHASQYSYNSGTTAFIPNISFDAKSGSFKDQEGRKLDSISFHPLKLETYCAKIDVPLGKLLVHCIYVPGSPYYSILDTLGRFCLQVPQGVHSGRLISIDGVKPGRAPIFLLNDSIRSESPSDFLLGSIEDSIDIPFNIKDLLFSLGRK